MLSMTNRFFNLQICTDLARIALNLPLFSKTSLVTPHVFTSGSHMHVLYAVRNCPEEPPTKLPYIHLKTPVKSVKTRRKSLVSNKVYLQMAGSTCWRDGLTIQELETCTRCITEVCRANNADSTCWQDGFSNPGMANSPVAYRRIVAVCVDVAKLGKSCVKTAYSYRGSLIGLEILTRMRIIYS
jgi:hypothetical protein